MEMKIAHIVGNRPQFIKLSMLYREWQERSNRKALIIHTGQHFHDNMSSVFFDQFELPAPEYNLGVNNFTHNEMIGRMLIALDPVLAAEQPDCVVVYGDTNSTLAGALAARKRNIPVAHIESGIRTGKEDMPEESNRYLTDRMADLNFACTYLGMENLIREGVEGKAYLTGDLMLDAALRFRDTAREQSTVGRELGVEGRSFVLATIHRAENAEDPVVLRGILEALNDIHRQEPVILPLHPKTKQLIDRHHLPVNFLTTPPLGYFDMLALLEASSYAITDSGGLTREAFFFHRPALVVMQNPFWPEVFIHGPHLQARADAGDILEKYAMLRRGRKPFSPEIFGNGHAAGKICDILREAL